MELTRDIHADTLAAISGPFHFPIVFVYLDWPAEVVRVHSGVGDVYFGGHNWKGIGRFGRISVPAEGMGLAQTRTDLMLLGAPDELDAYLDSPIRGRRGEIWYGCTTERAGNTLIGEPFRVFVGFMDAMRDSMESEDGDVVRAITISVADGPSQRLATTLYHTDEDQRRSHPTDTGGRLTLFAEKRAQDLKWPE